MYELENVKMNLHLKKKFVLHFPRLFFPEIMAIENGITIFEKKKKSLLEDMLSLVFEDIRGT